MNIALVTNLWREPDTARQRELDYALAANESSGFDKMVVLAEPGMDLRLGCPMLVVTRPGRPKYVEMIAAINALHDIDVAVIANADIQFPPQTVEQCRRLPAGEAWALTPWDETASGWRLLRGEKTQDAWVLPVPIKSILGADFSQGIKGCDNRFAWLLAQAGYHVRNPAKTVKTLHLHASGARRYNRSQIIPGPYKFLPPVEL